MKSFSSKLLSDKNIDWLQFFSLSRQTLKLWGNFRPEVPNRIKCGIFFLHKVVDLGDCGTQKIDFHVTKVLGFSKRNRSLKIYSYSFGLVNDTNDGSHGPPRS